MGNFGSMQDNGQCSYSEWRSATCPICGKRYRHTAQHAYHAGDRLVCSWGCQRRWEREEAEKRPADKKFTRPEHAKIKQRVTRCRHRAENARLVCEAPGFCALPEAEQARLREALSYWEQKLSAAQAELDALGGTS